MSVKYSINTSQNVNIQYEMAGMGDRVIALIVDLLILTGISIAVSLLLSSVKLSPDYKTALYILFSFVAFLFQFIQEWFMNGQTVGKKYREIKVIHKSGHQASLWQIFIRNLIRPVDMIYGLGVLVVFFSKKNQRLGDLAANTIITKHRKNDYLKASVLADDFDNYQAVYEKSDIFKLDENDIELIKELINRESTKQNWELVALLCKKIEEKSNTSKESLNSLSYLKTIVKDFNYYSMGGE